MLKKQSLMPMILILLLAISLVGCSSSSKSTSDKTDKSEKAAAVSAKSQTESSQVSSKDSVQASTTRNGAQSGRTAGTRVMGQIVSIKDRTVTIALFDMPSPPDNGLKPSAPHSANDQDATSGATPPAGNQPGGQTPQLSGEKKTIIIPANVKILSGGVDNSTVVSLSTLKAGQMMEVKLNSSTGVVEAVRVMEAGQRGAPPQGSAPSSPSANQ